MEEAEGPMWEAQATGSIRKPVEASQLRERSTDPADVGNYSSESFYRHLGTRESIHRAHILLTSVSRMFSCVPLGDSRDELYSHLSELTAGSQDSERTANTVLPSEYDNRNREISTNSAWTDEHGLIIGSLAEDIG